MPRSSAVLLIWATRAAALGLLIVCFVFGQQVARALAANWSIGLALTAVGFFAVALWLESRLRRVLKSNRSETSHER